MKEKPPMLSPKVLQRIAEDVRRCADQDQATGRDIARLIHRAVEAQRDADIVWISEEIKKVEKEKFTRIPPEYDRGYSNGFHDAKWIILALLK